MRAWLGVVLWSVALMPGLAEAQLSFSDGFETGTLLATDSPPGEWTTQTVEPGFTVVADSAAWRTGSFGLQVVDTATGGGSGIGGDVRYTFSPYSGDLHYRFAVRFGAGGTTGYVTIAVVHGLGGVTSLVDIHVGFPAIEVRSNGSSAGGAGLFQATGISLTVGQWHVIELIIRGVGTANGEREVWVDGQLGASMTGIEWTGLQMTRLLLGEVYGTRSWVGTLSFDDVAASSMTLPPVTDGGMNPPDAGTLMTDGGVMGSDGGVMNPDGGVQPIGIGQTPAHFDVGCGCGGVPGSAPLFLLSALVLARRIAKRPGPVARRFRGRAASSPRSS